jgi:hypothetical protein
MSDKYGNDAICDTSVCKVLLHLRRNIDNVTITLRPQADFAGIYHEYLLANESKYVNSSH